MKEDLPEGAGMGKETAERAGKAPVAGTSAAYGAFTQHARAVFMLGPQVTSTPVDEKRPCPAF